MNEEGIEVAGSGGSGDPPLEMLAHAAAAFGLLASSARLQIMWVLAQGDSDVSQLGARVGRALPTVSQHLAQLKAAGLVQARREGRRHIYSVNDLEILAVIRLMMGHLAQGALPIPAPVQGRAHPSAPSI